jgi:hypothetical protein
VLALIGIGLALVAIQGRPARQPLEIDKPTVPPVAPADLAALGYLPDDTDMIAAVHLAEALDNPVGRDLLWRVGLDGAGAPDLARWTGLKLEDIDHAALGVKLGADLPVSEVLVIRSRRPLDPQAVRDALKAKAREEVAGRPAYPFVLETGLPLLASLNLAAWFADEHTLVLAKKERFERIPIAPKAGIDHLRPALREVLKERMGPAAQVWTAAHTDSWNALNPFLVRLPLEGRLGDGADKVKKVRTLAVWFTADREGVTLGGACDSADEEGAKALAAFLAPKDRKGLRDVFAPPDAGAMGRELVDSLKTTQHGTWVDVQAKASADAVRGKK